MQNKSFLSLLLILAILIVSSSVFATSGSGKYLSYNFTYKAENGLSVFTFDPALERNDQIVVGSMVNAISIIYGKHLLVSTWPILVPGKNGMKLFQFEGKSYYYLFLIVKNDNGEVQGFSLWRKAKN